MVKCFHEISELAIAQRGIDQWVGEAFWICSRCLRNEAFSKKLTMSHGLTVVSPSANNTIRFTVNFCMSLNRSSELFPTE